MGFALLAIAWLIMCIVAACHDMFYTAGFAFLVCIMFALLTVVTLKD